MLTTNESASASSSASRTPADSDGGEMDAAPDGDSAGDDVGERPRPAMVESAEDLRDYEMYIAHGIACTESSHNL